MSSVYKILDEEKPRSITVDELFEIARNDAELYEYVMNFRFRPSAGKSPTGSSRLFDVTGDDGRQLHMSDETLRHSIEGLVEAIIATAGSVVAAGKEADRG